MSGPTPPHDSPPPEVPEEFAAAYWAAYERAMADPPGEPEEREPVPVGRPAPLARSTRDVAAADARRVRGSAWLATLLLGLLAAVIVLAAYALGR